MRFILCKYYIESQHISNNTKLTSCTVWTALIFYHRLQTWRSSTMAARISSPWIRQRDINILHYIDINLDNTNPFLVLSVLRRLRYLQQPSLACSEVPWDERRGGRAGSKAGSSQLHPKKYCGRNTQLSASIFSSPTHSRFLWKSLE